VVPGWASGGRRSSWLTGWARLSVRGRRWGRLGQKGGRWAAAGPEKKGGRWAAAGPKSLLRLKSKEVKENQFLIDF
jgi:hypothetical protein